MSEHFTCSKPRAPPPTCGATVSSSSCTSAVSSRGCGRERQSSGHQLLICHRACSSWSFNRMRRNISGGAGWRRSGAAGAQDSQSDITDRSARSDHVSEPRRSTPAHTRPRKQQWSIKAHGVLPLSDGVRARGRTAATSRDISVEVKSRTSSIPGLPRKHGTSSSNTDRPELPQRRGAEVPLRRGVEALPYPLE